MEEGVLTMNNLKNHILLLWQLCGLLGMAFDNIMRELTQYKEHQGPYFVEETVDICLSDLLPHQWWNKIGGQAWPAFAKHVLALTCSTLPCEWNWSMYSFIYRKSRNQ